MNRLHYYSPEDIIDIEKAICFLTNEYQKSGHNKKPVVGHSLRLGFYLLEKGYKKKVIIAGILHDLLEDTDVSFQKISEIFGMEISNLVLSVTFDPKIIDPVEQYNNLFTKVLIKGRDAFIIKAVDLLMNSQYIHLVTDKRKRKGLIRKNMYFLSLFEEFKDELIYKILKQEIENLE